MRTRILGIFVTLALEKRRWVFTGTVLVALVSLYLAGQLGMNFQWTTLLPESMPVVQEYKRVSTEYPVGSNYIITIKASSPEEIERAVDLIVPRVEALQEHVITTYGSMPEDFMVDHGLRSLKPKDLRRAGRIFSDPRLITYLTHLNDDFEREYTGSDENIRNQERTLVRNVQALEEFVTLIGSAASGEEISESSLFRMVRDNTTGNPYYLSLDRTMGVIMVAQRGSLDDFDDMMVVDKAISAELDKIEASLSGVTIGTSGGIPIGRDELESIGPYTYVLMSIALVLVLLVLIWNFRSIWIPFLSLVPIIFGILVAMGFYALTVRELNIFTVTINIVLIGLGIDFAIHMVSRFYEHRGQSVSLEESLEAAVIHTGKGIITGALTTAMAFLSLMTAQTKGIKEFGFCAGFGILILLLSIFVTLPSLLVWRDKRLQKKQAIFRVRDFRGLGSVAHTVSQWRLVTITGIIILGIAAAFVLPGLEYEYDLLELEPVGLESIELQDEIVERFKMSIEMAFITTATVEEARELEKSLKKKSVVGDVESISLLIPAPEWVEENDRTLVKLASDIKEQRPELVLSGAENEVNREKLAAEMDRFLANLIEIEQLSFIGGQDRVVAAIERLTGGEKGDGPLVKLVNLFQKGDVNWSTLDRFAGSFEQQLRERVTRMAQLTGPVTEEMIPSKLLSLYRSPDSGRYLVQIWPRKNLYDREPLMRFNDAIGSLSDTVTGFPQLIILINDEMVREGKVALLLASIVILVLLIADMRSFTTAILATIPLFFGALLTLSFMALTGIKLNFVNIIALPIIIGIGVDDGVHLLHRWRQEGPGGLKISTARVGHAILMTSITTMIGFGSVYFYTHRGIASLGQVLFIGVGFCFVCTILILPPIVQLLEKYVVKQSHQGGNHG